MGWKGPEPFRRKLVPEFLAVSHFRRKHTCFCFLFLFINRKVRAEQCRQVVLLAQAQGGLLLQGLAGVQGRLEGFLRWQEEGHRRHPSRSRLLPPPKRQFTATSKSTASKSAAAAALWGGGRGTFWKFWWSCHRRQWRWGYGGPGGPPVDDHVILCGVHALAYGTAPFGSYFLVGSKSGGNTLVCSCLLLFFIEQRRRRRFAC